MKKLFILFAAILFITIIVGDAYRSVRADTVVYGSGTLSSIDDVIDLLDGTPDGTQFFRDDGVLAVPPGGGDVTSVGTCTTGECFPGFAGDQDVSTTATPTLAGANIGNVEDAELQFLDGVTSAIQAQLDSRVVTTDNAGSGFYGRSGGVEGFYTSFNLDMTQNTLKIASTVSGTSEIGYDPTTRRLLASYGSGTSEFAPMTSANPAGNVCVEMTSDGYLVTSATGTTCGAGGGSSAWGDLTGVPDPVTALTNTNTGDETEASIISKLTYTPLAPNGSGASLTGLLFSAHTDSITASQLPSDIPFSTLTMPNTTDSAPTGTSKFHYNPTTRVSSIGTGTTTQEYLYTDGSAANLTDFPTLNQNTTGSAATLTTPRAIYGNNFDGSAALTQAIANTYGGMGANTSAWTGVIVESSGTFTTKTNPTGAFVGTTDTQTLENKRITSRVTSTTSAAAPTPNADVTDVYLVTALTETATFGAPTGTPTDGQKIIYRIKDDGTARVLAWNAIYRESTDLNLPVTTTISKTMYVGFMYNSAASKWDLLSLMDGF